MSKQSVIDAMELDIKRLQETIELLAKENSILKDDIRNLEDEIYNFKIGLV